MPAVSVIIPAYNSSAYIGPTIESVLNQTFTDFEVLIIDDGSEDSTMEIVTGYADKDSRVSVYSLEHTGPASARNLGLEKSTGDYIYFIDADDMIVPDMLLQMYNEACRYNAQMVACGYTLETWVKGRVKNKEFSHGFLAAKQAAEFRNALLDLMKSHLMYVVWNKLISREFLQTHNITFRRYLIGEDRLFICDTFEYLERFVVVPTPLHRYINRGQGSLISKYVPNRIEALTLCYHKLNRLYEQWDMLTNENRRALNYIYIKAVVSCFTQLYSKSCPLLTYKEKVEYVRPILADKNVQAAAKSHDKEVPYSNLIAAIVRTNSPFLILAMAKTIYFMSVHVNSLFLKMKHLRIRRG